MSRRRRIPFLDIARRITGISTPAFGISWNPPEDTRDIVRSLVAFLEDRRALYTDYNVETPLFVVQSVLEIRAQLTDVLRACPEDANLTEPIRAMRAACRKFLDAVGGPGRRNRGMYGRWESEWLALGELRAIFGLHLARLCAAYGVDAEPELASIFPEADEEPDQKQPA